MARRRHLGSVYTMYPAKSMGIWFGTKLYKLIASFVCCAVFTGIYYVFIGVVNFNKNNFMYDSPKTTTEVLIMKKLRLALLPLVLGSVVLWTASCESSQEKPAKNRWKIRSPYRKSYPKLKNYKLVLIPVSKKSFLTDQKKEFNFSLRNIGNNTVRIDEWFMEEPDNIRFYVHPFENKPVKFDRKTWKCWIPPMKKKTERFQLELMTGNAALVMTTMPFLDDLKLEAGKTTRIMVVAELNLTSVSVRTMPFIVAVHKK